MIEVRRIQDSEAEQFLDILCSVFHLDGSRAKPVFYDPVLYDLNRKWALFQDREMVSILTTTGLTFGWGRCIGIAGVATVPPARGKGHGRRLLEAVLAQAEEDGEGPAMLFAHEETLYERLGFEVADEVIRAPILNGKEGEDAEPLANGEVKSLYGHWSGASPDRLVRTDDRWRYWGMACRMCEPFYDGYYCAEPGLVREVVCGEAHERWPVPAGTDWYGLRTVAQSCRIPIRRSKVELLFMTRGVPGKPQMFMTDQF